MVGFSSYCLSAVQVVMEPLTCEHDTQAFLLNLGIILFSSLKRPRGESHRLSLQQQTAAQTVLAGVALNCHRLVYVVIFQNGRVRNHTFYFLNRLVVFREPMPRYLFVQKPAKRLAYL